MDFRIEQRFAADAGRVQAALLDPDFLGRLGELPRLGGATLVSRDVDGDTVRQHVRYAFVGQLSSAVRAVVDPARLTWVEEATTHVASRRTDFTIVPDHYEGLLRCRGRFEITPHGEGSIRVATGVVSVSVLLVGRKVEAAIVTGLREHAEAEAAVVEEWLGDH